MVTEGAALISELMAERIGRGRRNAEREQAIADSMEAEIETTESERQYDMSLLVSRFAQS